MSVEEILKTETSPSFWAKMKNSMVLSFYKYGALKDGAPKSDAIANLMVRLRKYADTGNTEYLVDVANFAMIEFMYPKHPNAHYKAEDSAASPGIVRLASGRLEHTNNAGEDLKSGYSSVSSVANIRRTLTEGGS